jgi:hypothetical protein
MFGHAKGAVAEHHRDPAQPGRSQVGPRLLGQVGKALDRHHPAGEQGKDGRLEAESGADLQDPLAPAQLRAAAMLAIRLGWVVTCPCGMRMGAST